MSAIIKTEDEIQKMREGGRILHDILHELKRKVAPGIKTYELEELAEELFAKHNVEPSFKNYKGYPASICTAVNEEVVHSIPGNRILKEGDILSIDAGVFHKGFHTDSAIAVEVGHIDEDSQKFIATCKKALEKAIETARPGIHIVEIGRVIQNIVEKEGYSIVKELIGHGVGRNIHEKPEVPNFRTRSKGTVLKPGMTFAIEPIIAMGEGKMEILEDGWTIVTKDRSRAVQVEHTIAITKDWCEVLTR